jgi:hypothetical protein
MLRGAHWPVPSRRNRLVPLVTSCRHCGGPVEAAHRFCPWCATVQRSKFVEFFRPHPAIERGERALRVSRYFGPEPEERHVRVSIWTGDRADTAISLPEDEAHRLAHFLAMPRPRGATVARRLLERIRA